MKVKELRGYLEKEDVKHLLKPVMPFTLMIEVII